MAIKLTPQILDNLIVEVLMEEMRQRGDDTSDPNNPVRLQNFTKSELKFIIERLIDYKHTKPPSSS